MAKLSAQKKESLQETNTLLRDVDKDILVCLYKMRCLSMDMAFRFFYSKKLPRISYCRESIYKLEECGLIEIIQNDNVESEIFFITALGILYITTYVDAAQSGIVREVWDEASGAFVNAIKKPAQLKIQDRLIKHQLSLNYFMLEYMEFADEHNISYDYYDLVFAPKCSDKMMPDGVLVLKDKIVLIEMDTGTEGRSRLTTRWNGYRSFFARPEPFYNELPITVLFILESASDSIARRTSFINTICESDLISDITDNIEFYAVSMETAKTMLCVGMDQKVLNQELTAFATKTLVQKYGFSFYHSDFTLAAGAPEFGYYICKKSGGSESILELDGTPIEYLLDIWGDERYSVLHKIIYMYRINSLLKRSKNIHREIPYIVVVPDMRLVAGIMKYAGVRSLKNVYFTTKKRMEQNLPFYEMIFTMDDKLQIRHFIDYSLTKTVYEKKYDPTHPE